MPGMSPLPPVRPEPETLPVNAPAPRRAALLALAVFPMVGMIGCASRSGGGTAAPAPAPSGAAPVPPAGARRRTLASERKRLAALLRDTPVTVDSTDDGAVRVLVPLEFCFERRRSAVRPALGAVLNHVALGAREEPGFELRVLAPGDAAGPGNATLAQDRAASVRDYLVGKGVPRPRIVQTGRNAEPQVQVLMSERGD